MSYWVENRMFIPKAYLIHNYDGRNAMNPILQFQSEDFPLGERSNYSTNL